MRPIIFFVTILSFFTSINAQSLSDLSISEKIKYEKEQEQIKAYNAYQKAYQAAQQRAYQKTAPKDSLHISEVPTKVTVRKPASVEKKSFQKKLEDEIKQLAPEFKTQFKDEKWLIVTILQTGEFAYQKNSHILTPKAIDKIRTFFDRISEYPIKKIGIYGHSSPQFAGKFQDPNIKNNHAYQYNLELSNERANYINDLIEHPELKKITNSKGVGYAFPIPKKSEEEISECGDFDCEASRRIEISIKF